jgi:hypothetical protein
MFHERVDPLLGGWSLAVIGVWPAFDVDGLDAKIDERRGRSWPARAWGRLHRTHPRHAELWGRVMAHWRAA